MVGVAVLVAVFAHDCIYGYDGHFMNPLLSFIMVIMMLWYRCHESSNKRLSLVLLLEQQ
jgi:hypothetical protein